MTGEISLEVHAVCGICQRRIRIPEKVKTFAEAESKLKEADWVKSEQSGWICFVCKGMPERNS